MDKPICYTIPKAWRVVVWLRSLHTDANYYDDEMTHSASTETDGTYSLRPFLIVAYVSQKTTTGNYILKSINIYNT